MPGYSRLISTPSLPTSPKSKWLWDKQQLKAWDISETLNIRLEHKSTRGKPRRRTYGDGSARGNIIHSNQDHRISQQWTLDQFAIRYHFQPTGSPKQLHTTLLVTRTWWNVGWYPSLTEAALPHSTIVCFFFPQSTLTGSRLKVQMPNISRYFHSFV